MPERRGLFRKLQLLLDRDSARKVERDAQKSLNKATDPKKAEKNVSRVDRAFTRLRSAVLKVGAAIGVAFAGRALLRFGRDSVRVAAEADAIWTRLGGTLQTVGVDLASVRKEIDASARAMQDASTVGDEDFAQILQALIVVSGDYANSLRNVELVANLAAGAQMDYVSASRLVGRAMIGDTATLKRYGIVVGEGEDAIEAMRRQFAGLAENEARSLQGRIKQVNNEWDDFKQAVGEAITEASDGESVLVTVRDTIKSITQSINENKGSIQRLGGDISQTIRFFVTLGGWIRRTGRGLDELFSRIPILGRRLRERLEDEREALERAALLADELKEIGLDKETPTPPPPPPGPTDEDAEKAEKALRTRIDLLGKARELHVLTSANIQEIVDLEVQAREELARGVDGLERRVQLTERLATLEEMRAGLIFQLGRPRIGLEDSGGAPVAAEVEARIGPALEHMQQVADVLREDWGQVEDALSNAAYGIAGAWQDAFGIILAHGGDVGESLEAIFRGTLAAGLGGLAQYASAKIAENIAIGFEEKAKAAAALANPLTAGLAPIHLAASKGAFLAAAKWGAYAGLAGAAQAAVARGGRGGISGGVPSGARDIGGRLADDRNPPAPEVHIYIDPLDPSRPAYQKNVGAAYQMALQRYGKNVRIHAHPGGSR